MERVDFRVNVIDKGMEVIGDIEQVVVVNNVCRVRTLRIQDLKPGMSHYRRHMGSLLGLL